MADYVSTSTCSRSRAGNGGRRGLDRLGALVLVDVLLGLALAGACELWVVDAALGVHPAGAGVVRVEHLVARVEDGKGAAVGLGALVEAARGAGLGCARAPAVVGRRRVAADLGYGGRAGSRGAGRDGGRVGADRGGSADGRVGACDRVVDLHVLVAAAASGGEAGIVGLARVHPAGAGPGVGVEGEEDEEFAGGVSGATVPTGLGTASSDGESVTVLGLRVVAELSDERGSTA